MFGAAPELAPPGARHVLRPSDAEVNELLNRCAVFVQTSGHEGFGLPALEAMATGAAVVCTDADGNRDYCEDGVNCLVPAAEPDAVAAAIRALLADPPLRARLGEAGIATAARYTAQRRAHALERYLGSIATGAPRRAEPRG